MKRIYLVNITGAYQVVIPYSSGLLQSYCSTDPQLVKNYFYCPFVFHAPQGIDVEASRISNPSVLGLSLLSWNLRRSLKLARLVKDKFPECLVVVGGPEVPDKSETFLRTHPYIDLAVHKEGEETFRQILVENLNVKPDWKKVSGISFVNPSTGAYRNISRQHSFLNPISTPSPHLMGLFEESLEYVDYLGLPRVNIWETNRGCPYGCTFCDWGSATNQKIRLVSEERVNLEIDHITETYDEVHVADANFSIHKRDLQFARRMAEGMANGRLKSAHITYTKAVNEDTIEVAKILETRGISRAGFTFAFNSLDRSTLKTIKRYNVPREKFSAIKSRMDELGIPTNTELIWGLPGETKDTFFEGFESCMDAGLTDIRTYQLNLYPNNEVSDERSRSEFEIETYWVKIVKGVVDEEDEYIETVKSTSQITSDEMWKVKKTVELIDVIHCFEHTDKDSVVKEMVLVKLSAPSEGRTEILQILEHFNGKTVDLQDQSLIVMITGNSDKVDAAVHLLGKFEIIETVRTGKVVMARGVAET